MKDKLLTNIKEVKEICLLIDKGEDYKGRIHLFLSNINETISWILTKNLINQQFVIQVLKDIVYAVEYEDTVILKDTLRYGLLEIYYYVNENCQCEE